LEQQKAIMQGQAQDVKNLLGKVAEAVKGLLGNKLPGA
jgi:hypothetical protein